MSLETFPKESLVPSQASIRRGRFGFDIRIDLQPFTLDDEKIETAFCLDGARLPADTRAWARQTFTFPRNPTDGYIDGSVYIRHVHNPAEVTSIRFGELTGDTITAEFSIQIIFEFEVTGFQNTDVKISVPLKIHAA
jgi:hypothetical protein